MLARCKQASQSSARGLIERLARLVPYEYEKVGNDGGIQGKAQVGKKKT
jgi:hypothetical protein